MFSVFRIYIMQKISSTRDAGHPLGALLRWLTKNDAQLHRFYENSLHLEEKLKEDLPVFLQKKGIPETQMHISIKKQIDWNCSSEQTGKTVARRLQYPFVWSTVSIVLLTLLFVGIGYFQKNREGLHPLFSGKEVAIGMPLGENVSLDPALEWNGNMLGTLVEESGNILRQLPLFEPTSSKALTFVLNDPETNAQFP